jgi:hypothetical protein
VLSSDFAPRGWSGPRSPAGATGSNPWQKHSAAEPQKRAKTVASVASSCRAERTVRVELGPGEFTGEFNQKYLQTVSRRSRKPLSVVRRIEGSNPSPSAFARKLGFRGYTRFALWRVTGRDTPLKRMSPMSSNSTPASPALRFASSLTSTSRGPA